MTFIPHNTSHVSDDVDKHTFISMSSRFCRTASRWAMGSESTAGGDPTEDGVIGGGVAATSCSGDLPRRPTTQQQALNDTSMSVVDL